MKCLIVYITHVHISTCIQHTPIPAYRIAQNLMADRRSGKNTTHTCPCLPDRTNGRLPVREKYDTHLSLPTGSHKWKIAGQGKIRHTPIPAYQIAQMADRRSGKNTHTPIPAYRTAQMADLQSGKNTHTPVPAYRIAQMADRRSGKNTTPVPAYRIAQMADRRSGKNTTHTCPCLPDRTNGRSPVREKYDTHLSLPTGSHKWQIAGQGKIRHLSLPTGSHKWQIAGQGKIRHTPVPAYRIAQMADRRSGKNTTHTCPCLPDRTNGRSPVREKYDTHLSLPTGSHKWQIAGQGKNTTHTCPCLPDRTNGRSPVREKIHTPVPAYRIAQTADRRSGKKYTHLSLPTGSHKRQIAGQGKNTHTCPCLPDRTNGRSPVREKIHTPVPAYRIAQTADRRSGKKYTHLSLPTGSHKRQIAGQGKNTHTCPCLPDRTNGRLPVREKIHTPLPAYRIAQTAGRSPVREKIHTHTYPCLFFFFFFFFFYVIVL